LDRLRENGVLRIIGLLDPAATGFPVYAMIGIRVKPGVVREVGRRLAAMGCVAYVGYTTGRFDIITEAMLESNEALHIFLVESLGSISGINSVEAFNVLAFDKFNYMWDLPDPSQDWREKRRAPSENGLAAAKATRNASEGRRAAGPADLDALDRQILRLLRDDGRRPNADIARAVGVSEPTVRKRLDRLRESGVLRVIGLLDPAATGFPVDVLIGIQITAGLAWEVGRRLAAMDCVAFVGYTTGRYNIVIEAVFADNRDLLDFLGDTLGTIEGISATETFNVLDTEKFNYMWDLPDGPGG
jgi:Lrp/AsnC family transcriptional regulator for asnA, asnC and gidA